MPEVDIKGAATGATFRMDFPATLEAVVTAEESGGFSARVPALPGCFTEADTVEDLRTNLREAAECWLEARASLDDQPS